MYGQFNKKEPSNVVFTTQKKPVLRGFTASQLCTVAKIIVSDCGDKVDSGIELSYRPARLSRQLYTPVRD
jgi:hypothetical protein